MPQPNGKLTDTAYADHLRGCADLAIEIAQRMNIHEDSARQATFATVIINAERHNIFMEPHPPHSKTPVIPPEPAAADLSSEPVKSVETAAAAKDKAAAEKADAQVADMPRNPTEEQSDGQRRTSFLAAIQSARELLNKEGFTPPLTPVGLNKIINDDLGFPNNLGTLDVDQLEKVTMHLSRKLDTFRANKKALEADAPF